MNISAYCISLRENEVERQRCQTEFNRIPFTPEFHIVDRDPQNGARGCFNSHLEVLRRGLEAESEYIAVFEDDVYFEFPSEDIWNQLLTFVQEIEHIDGNWCMCFGYFTNSRAFHIRDNIVALDKCYCSHAYLIPKRTAQRLVEMIWTGRPYDMAWHGTISNFYAPYPIIAYQRDHPSSISTDWGGWLIQKMGHRRIAKLCQWWSHAR